MKSLFKRSTSKPWRRGGRDERMMENPPILNDTPESVAAVGSNAVAPASTYLSGLSTSVYASDRVAILPKLSSVGPTASLAHDSNDTTDPISHEQHSIQLKEVPPAPKIDLWERAYKRVREDAKTKTLFESYENILQKMPIDKKGTKNLQEQILAILDKKMLYFTSQQWKVDIGGKEFTIREQIDRMVKILRVVKDFGSSTASIEPTYAGLPWAGISVLLTLIINDSEQHAKAISGLERVTNMIPYYTAIEENLGGKVDKAEDVKGVHDRLSTHYGLVLRYQAEAVCFFGRDTFSRFLRNLIPLEDWEGILAEIESAAADCDKFMTALKWSDLLEIQQQQSESLEKVIQNIQNNDDEKEAILSWVSEVPNQDDYEFVLKQKLGQNNWCSGQWLLQDARVLAWEKADNGVLWLRGAVGTGKSCLTSLVIRQLLRDESPERLAYFYCSKDSSRRSRTDGRDVMRSFLAQLSYSRLEFVRKEYQDRRARRGTLGLDDCTRLLSELINSAGSCTVVLDALDECINPYDLMNALKQVSDSTKLLKIFVSSRLEDKVTVDFPQRLCISVASAGNQRDLESFIDTEIHRRRSEINRRNPEQPEELNDELADELTSILKSRAEGMFRWVELQLDLFLSLNDDPLHHDTIQEQLAILRNSATIPELNNTYDQVYERNTRERNYRKLAIKSLQWVISSARPLDVQELITAVAIRPDFSMDSSVTASLLLNRICSNFITVDRFGIIQFTHLSVREYLEQKSEDYSLPRAHTQAAESCLAFIQQPGFNFTENLPIDTGFPSYATRYWPYHCKAAASKSGLGEGLRELSHNFRSQGDSILQWAEAFEYHYHRLEKYKEWQMRYEEKLLEVEVLSLRLAERDEIVRLANARIGEKNRTILYLKNYLRNHGFRVDD